MPTKSYPALQQSVLLAFLPLASSPSHPPIHLLPPFFIFFETRDSLNLFLKIICRCMIFLLSLPYFKTGHFFLKKIRCFSPPFSFWEVSFPQEQAERKLAVSCSWWWWLLTEISNQEVSLQISTGAPRHRDLTPQNLQICSHQHVHECPARVSPRLPTHPSSQGSHRSLLTPQRSPPVCSAIGAHRAHTAHPPGLRAWLPGSRGQLRRRGEWRGRGRFPKRVLNPLASASAIYRPVWRRLSPSLTLIGVIEIKY